MRLSQSSNFLILFCFVAIGVVLTGCSAHPFRIAWRADENKQTMVGLKPDMTIEQVTKLMGQPDKTEMYRGKNNEVILTYLYITKGVDPISGRMDESNYTPLIFINDLLNGWGWNQFNTITTRYEIIIKER